MDIPIKIQWIWLS